MVLAGQPGWGWAPVDRITQEGEPHPGCSRSFLRSVVADAEQVHGVTFQAAIEIEWALARLDSERDFVPAVSGPAYGATRQVELSDYAAELLAALAAQGVDVEQLHPEYAAGQFELSVGALDPVAAADRSVLVRQTIRAVSRRHGLRRLVRPGGLRTGRRQRRPRPPLRLAEGVNLHAGGERPVRHDAEAESFTAGVLAHLPGLHGD